MFVTKSTLRSFATFVIEEHKDLLRLSVTGLHVLDLVTSGSLEPDRSLYTSILKKCTLLKKLDEARMVHAHVANLSQFNKDLVLQNTLLNTFCKCGSMVDARKVFDEMLEKDMVTWTALITGYSQNDQPLDAIGLFPSMLAFGFQPNEFTLSSVLKACGAAASDCFGRQVHAYCFKYGYAWNVYVGSSVLDMYARFGRMDDAQLAFDTLESKNEVSWNALIAGYARKAEGEHALATFVGMLQGGLEPTHFTYSSVFTALAGMGSLEQGKWVHAHVIKSGGKLVAYVGNTLVDMYAKSGSIDDARKVFDRLERRDVVSWNCMITGYAQHGLGKEAVKWFAEMLRVGIAPNQITFLCVLTACSHAGLLDKGLEYFELMNKYNIKPQEAHYVTMVDLLGRAGRLDQAHKFINTMPIQPTAAVWGALLGACRMHKNMDMGAYAAERIFELDPHDSGPHVLLANMYASAGRLSDAAKVRRMMKESGVKKEPACSWIETKNAVHMFVANDHSHPQRKQIHKVWKEIYRKIKEIGYVPDSSHVLFYADEEEREVKLQLHSEKLALAFALINTPPGSTIRIKKNIRVCGDCHSAFKLASIVIEREIILRDTNRYHHFRNGSCSCGDYW